MPRQKLMKNLFKPTVLVKKHNPTGVGNEGFDNSRENIDPHIKTKALELKEIIISNDEFRTGIELCGHTIVEDGITMKCGVQYVNPSHPFYTMIQTSVNFSCFGAGVNGETFRRIVIRADGRFLFGGGVTTWDTNLYRSAPHVLKTDDALHVGETLNFLEITSTGDVLFHGTGGLVFGSMYNDNTSTNVIIGATGTFVRIPSGFIVGQLNNCTFGNAREITVLKAGKYKIDWSISAALTSGANDDIEGAIGIDNVKNPQGTAHRIVAAASDIGAFSGTAILDLAANKVVSLMVTNNTVATNITITHSSLSLVQVGGT